MPNSQPSNAELVQLLEPWFPFFARIGAAVERDFLAAVPILGLPRKTERANDFHRAWRENLRRVEDLIDPLLVLVGEPEGEGLDYLLCQMNPEMPFILRWARIPSEGRVRRNRTERNRQIQEQGLLFGSMDLDDKALPTVTLAHTIEDEYTEAGLPCLWMGTLKLVRETPGDSEVITEVHVYSKPDRTFNHGSDLSPPLVATRETEMEEYRQIVSRIRTA